MKLLALTLVGVHAMVFPSVYSSDSQGNPSPYQVINVGMEAASPNPIRVRENYDEARNEAYNLAGLADRSWKGSAQLEAILAENSFLQKSSEDVPIVDVGLAKGVEHAQLGNTISNLQAAVRSNFAQGVAKLNQQYGVALAEAKTSIVDSVRRHFGAISFMNVAEPSFRVEIVPTTSDEAAGSAAAQQLFGRKQATVTALVDGASAELKEIAKILSSEFDKALSANVHSSFLGAVPTRSTAFNKQLNIRLTQSDAPSVADLLSDAISREDISEANLRGQILTIQLKLVQEINSFVAQMLQHVSSVA
jgi:hypothetical protein